MQYPGLGLYVYASTREILHLAVEKTWLGRERPTQIPVDSGEILAITPEGSGRPPTSPLRRIVLPAGILAAGAAACASRRPAGRSVATSGS